MKKTHLLLLLFALLGTLRASGQNEELTNNVVCDTLIRHCTIFYNTELSAPKQSEAHKPEEVLKWMKANPEIIIEIVGYADSRGTLEYNRILASKRANWIKTYLIDGGIDSKRITAHGNGIDKDVKDNSKARRVDVFKVMLTDVALQTTPHESLPNVIIKEVIKEVEVIKEIIKEVEVIKEIEITKEPTKYSVGLDMGMTHSISTLSAYGADKNRAGFAGGIYFRYNYNKIFSFDAVISVGRLSTANEECPYWLSTEGVKYNSPASNKECYSYNDLRSKAIMQQYAIRANVNVLGLFERFNDSKFDVNISPSISLIGTNAKILRIENEAVIYDPSKNWHFGIGVDLGVGYDITKELNVAIYTGITEVTGKGFDGMPDSGVHKQNYFLKSGFKFTYNIFK